MVDIRRDKELSEDDEELFVDKRGKRCDRRCPFYVCKKARRWKGLTLANKIEVSTIKSIDLARPLDPTSLSLHLSDI
jgi:hypothetical protein